MNNGFGYREGQIFVKGSREVDKLAQWMDEITKPAEKDSTKKPSRRKRKNPTG